ncbi:hypothetical protein [Streptomyces sp. NPDC090112]|uniref:hypothetical protein n=1 Tax=Streptomyces sp. NPDC090112 TaxID=3365949 RepID=UPI003819B314
MTPRSLPCGPTRTGTARTVASLAVLSALAAGCVREAAPDWGYPELGKTLAALSRALEDGCDEAVPESCVEDLDRLGGLAERAFGEVLDHELLDHGYVAAMNELDRAREARAIAAREARARSDPHFPPFSRAVAAERLAYRDLLDALRAARTAPPAGDARDPL